ncbi:hypothetical protein ABH930_001799 [Kitasatospora sp. GAS204A]|uniref:LAETG motif-containing sortase-dependent surface protein n=1 Tax=unclassified Kitasatospora TaxID=2633591 RepID=UPI002476CB39|nr:LAETG motif-containing sortase-dependent surface protein [Kitasatospora sp. GAS204B]MDH6117216.1 hypothetical protein [Kitasatospora sp. GAS204B]
MARQARITGRTFAGAAVLAVAATGLLAGTASAHTYTITHTCSSVTVNLANYNSNVTNTITVTEGDQTVLPTQTFKDTFQQTFQVDPKHSGVVDVTIAVVAGDDPTMKHTWTFTDVEHVPVCPTPTPTPSPTPPSPTPSPTPTTASPTPTTPAPTSAKPTTPAPKPTTPAPKPSSTGPSLAFTGGGSDSGMIAGVGAAVVVLGGGLVFMTRRRKAGRH